MTSTESSPKQETFLNLPNQLFGCFHSDDAARPAALPSARTFPKPDTGKEQHAFVAPLPKPSLFSAQGHSHFFLFASPWLWKYLAREGTYPHVSSLPAWSGKGGSAAGYTTWETGEGSTFQVSKLPWKEVWGDGKGEQCRGQEQKQSRKKENPDFCLVSQKNWTETWHLWP